MNKSNLFFAAIGLLFLVSSCVKDNCKKTLTYTKYTPVYKTYDEFRVTPTVSQAKTLKNPGKIYLFGNLLLINEVDEGVHVIDNADPASPNPIAFIDIPGNVDIAMSGNILYADNYIDLLAIDISDINNIRLQKRVNDAFPNYGIDPDKGVLVKFDAEEVTEEVDCNDFNMWNSEIMVDMGTGPQPANAGVSAALSSNGSRESVGVGGSMARFAISGQTLYTVDNQSMHVYDITTQSNPTKAGQVTVGWGWGIETIFPYGDKLFIGSNTGMYIYDNSNPHSPTYLSEFQHADACDPVFVEGDYAYVTLRSGTPCQGFANQMEIVDISNIMNPFLVSTTQLENPHGLSVENDIVYLCDGDYGIKVLDASDKNNVSELYADDSKPAYDAITVPSSNTLLMIGKDGFYQYSTTNPSALQLLSHIPVVE